MYAAVVTSFDDPPTYQEFPVPTPQSPDDLLVDVLAVGLHPRVRSQANGSHYASTGELPLIPGVDGVGRAADGVLRYFHVSEGAMAEQAVIDARRCVVLPDGVDPVAVAAVMNPAMSSWVALRRRIDFQPGQSVLVLGATGNAGRMAIQVAKRLGAGRVIGAGRNSDRLAVLAGLGADTIAPLDADLGTVAADVDVVIDYVWGQPAADVMRAIVTNRADRGRPLAWIQIGATAGATADIPSAALRAARLEIVGSGQGSVPTADILTELPGLAAEIAAGTFRVDAQVVPLADVQTAWTDTTSDRRIVITP